MVGRDVRASRRLAVAGLGIGALLTIAACTGSGAGSGLGHAGGESLPRGATIEEYQDALSEAEPVSLKFQMSSPQGHPSNEAYEAYMTAVEEWSGGGITFERGYSNSFVPDALAWASATADGRLDMVNFIPYMTPEVFPALSDLANASFLDGNTPTATLVGAGWMTEATQVLPVYQEEAEAAGLHLMLMPPTFNLAGYFCPEPYASPALFEGKQISAAGEGQFSQVEALGATPVSMSFTELYEGLQRGVVDCAATAVTALEPMGATPLVPNLITDTESGLATFASFMAFGAETWESLPLAGQQLLYDRMDVFIEVLLPVQSVRNRDWLEAAEEAGGGITRIDAAGAEALAVTNEGLLEELSGRGVDVGALLDSRDRWQGTVNELYPDLPVELDSFLRDGGYEDVDLQPYIDALFDEIFAEHRPS